MLLNTCGIVNTYQNNQHMTCDKDDTVVYVHSNPVDIVVDIVCVTIQDLLYMMYSYLAQVRHKLDNSYHKMYNDCSHSEIHCKW